MAEGSTLAPGASPLSSSTEVLHKGLPVKGQRAQVPG